MGSQNNKHRGRFNAMCTPVFLIARNQVPGDVSAKFHAHEQTVGNTCRRFHGTSCSAECQFFVDLKVWLLCGVIVTGTYYDRCNTWFGTFVA